MNKNPALDVHKSSSTLEKITTPSRRRAIKLSRHVRPWQWFGWLRKRLKSRSNREFYSPMERRQHQCAKMAQRLANHHHGFKF